MATVTETPYPWTAPHLGPLGHVAVLSARLEQIAGWIFGLLLDLDDARIGDVVSAPLSVSQVLERTRLLARIRIDDTSAIDRWVTAAVDATQQRNRLMHSAWKPTLDVATAEESLMRQRLMRTGQWDVEENVTLDSIKRVAVTLMKANAAGTNAYIVTERRLMGRTDLP